MPVGTSSPRRRFGLRHRAGRRCRSARLGQSVLKAGDQVAKDQPLAQLQNLDLDIQVAKLQGSLNENRVRLASLVQQGVVDHKAADQIPQIKEDD